MSSPQPNDAAVRIQALDPNHSFLVQAPAGSGKTELLTDRILALLALVQRPEEIVAITFTRAAAAEMHARVIEKLHAALEPEPIESYRKHSWQLAKKALANDAAQGWNLLQHPARLSIRTIDSLCAHLVRAMPWFSGLGGVPQVSDQVLHLYTQAAQATLVSADEQPAVTYLLQHLGVNIADTEQLLIDMLGKRDQWLPFLGQTVALGQEGEIVDVLQMHLQQLAQAALTKVAQQLPLGWQELAECAEYAHHNLLERDGDSNLHELSDWSERPLYPEAEDLARWQALRHLLLTKGGELRKAGGLNARSGFPANGNKVLNQQFKDWLNQESPDAQWIEALNQLQHLQAEYSLEQTELLEHLTQVLWLAVAQLRLVFIETGQVDFIEISQRALNALGEHDNPTDLLLRMDRRISHLLVDELQDTSLNQLQLLERLTAGWTAGDGRTVFLVGDPMQSIYRFRKAEVSLFLQVQQQQHLGEVELQALTLSDNFRSTANVVHWVNELGTQLFPAHSDLELSAVRYTPSVAFNSTVQDSGAYTHPFIYTDKNQELAARAAAEQQVVELCQQALVRYATSAKPVAILVRVRNHLQQLTRTLSQAGLPVRAVDIDELNARPVVEDLVQLIRALKHPGDRLAWLSLLRSPLCGLKLTSLHRLCGHDRLNTIPYLIKQADPTQWEADEWARLQHMAAVLLDDSHRSGGLAFAAWVEHCWLRLCGDHVYYSLSDRNDAECVFRLLEQLAPYGDLNIDQLEDEIHHLFSTTKSEGPAVEIMTIHRAKGLEFESVILYDLNRRGRSDTEPLLRVEQSQGRLYLGMAKASDAEQRDPLSLFIGEREKQRAYYELQRLLYVAVTRARSELHLVGLIERKADERLSISSGSLLELMWPVVESAIQAVPSLELEAAFEPTTPLAPYRYLQRIQQVDQLPQISPRPAPSGVNQWEWQTQPFKETAVGTVAHAWLERIGKDGRAVWPIERLEQCGTIIERQLRRAGLVEPELQLAVDEVVHTLLCTIQSTRGQWLLDAAKAYREWTLVDATGRVSIIDLAISQEDHWLIVDFKTSVPHANQSEADFLALMVQRYQDQLLRYKTQVSALDGRAARAALYFPRADLWYEI